MKLRVVDWVDYDDYDMPEGTIGWAARNAIIDDIRKHKYLFSGWAHQEGYRCTPLLNDGKIYRFSQRGWGDIMAEAHGEEGKMSYASYAFMMDRKFEKRPDRRAMFTGDFETDLNETFKVETSADAFESAQRENKIVFDNFEKLRYLDEGDTLVLSSNGETKTYLVTGVERSRDNTVEDEDKFLFTVDLSPVK